MSVDSVLLLEVREHQGSHCPTRLSARQFPPNEVKGTQCERRIFRVGFYEKLDDAVLFRVNEAISGGISCELLQVLPSYGKSFNRLDVMRPPGRRCCENIKRKLPLFRVPCFDFHQSLRHPVRCKQADALLRILSTTFFMSAQLAFLSSS